MTKEAIKPAAITGVSLTITMLVISFVIPLLNEPVGSLEITREYCGPTTACVIVHCPTNSTRYFQSSTNLLNWHTECVVTNGIKIIEEVIDNPNGNVLFWRLSK